MKKLILGTGLAALLATSAFAQSYDPEYGTANTIPTPPAWAATGTSGSAFA